LNQLLELTRQLIGDVQNQRPLDHMLKVINDAAAAAAAAAAAPLMSCTHFYKMCLFVSYLNTFFYEMYECYENMMKL